MVGPSGPACASPRCRWPTAPPGRPSKVSGTLRGSADAGVEAGHLRRRATLPGHLLRPSRGRRHPGRRAGTPGAGRPRGTRPGHPWRGLRRGQGPRPGHSKTRLSPPATPGGGPRLARGSCWTSCRWSPWPASSRASSAATPASRKPCGASPGPGSPSTCRKGTAWATPWESGFPAGPGRRGPRGRCPGRGRPLPAPGRADRGLPGRAGRPPRRPGAQRGRGLHSSPAGAVYPSLFREMTWSTRGSGETLRRCARRAAPPSSSPTWADVDDGQPLAALRDELRRWPRPGVAPSHPGRPRGTGGSTGSHSRNTAPIARPHARDMTHPHTPPPTATPPGPAPVSATVWVSWVVAQRGGAAHSPIPAPSRR